LAVDLLPAAYKVLQMTRQSLFAIVLAAGTASRFGSTKQLALYAGQPLVTRAIRTAEAICGSRSLLVTGSDWQNVAAACEPLRGFMILNPKYADGMASSLALGIRSVRSVAGGVLVMLADQPLVAAEQLGLLVNAWESSPDSICASAYANTIGPPVIFPARHFAELMALRGDRGAKAVIDSHREQLVSVCLDEAAVDIDCPDDLTRMGSEPF
jgi:CTP:molybdopterin cytidylyltransferase MocA